MINQVIWIWQYQEPETNKCRKSRCQKSNQNNLGFLALPKHISLFPTAHSIFPSSSLNIFFKKKIILKINKKYLYIWSGRLI